MFAAPQSRRSQNVLKSCGKIRPPVVLYIYTVKERWMMQVKVVRMRDRGVELDRRVARDGVAHRGQLVIMDSSDQGLRRHTKVARLMQGESVRYELIDVHIVWCYEGRMTLSGFERIRNEQGLQVDYAQSWLCTTDNDPVPELVLAKLRNVRPQR